MKFVPLGNIRISAWETRVQDYEAFCQATGRPYDPPDFQQTPTDPVVKVNWFDANAFCKWLTEKEHDENLLGRPADLSVADRPRMERRGRLAQ